MELSESLMDQEAIDNFRRYLRIPTMQPNVNYDECTKFLEGQAESLGLPYRIYRCAPDKPILIMTWTGSDPSLPSIWLGSHTDVVPVYEDKWTHKPFDAHMDDNGDIYARGAQDIKCLGIQYLEAVKRLRKQGATIKRTVHVAFVPEEEMLGVMGMRDFTQTADFRALNVGFALDEERASPDDTLPVSYGERTDWKIRIHCPGEQGHGSLLMPRPPGDKIGAVINKINEFRAAQARKYAENPTVENEGNLTSINLTILEGGVQANVVPPEFIATYDIRIPASVDLRKFERDLNDWCKEAGDDVWIEYTSKPERVENTKLDESNIFWTAFKKATDELNLTIVPIIKRGASDARFIRRAGIPAIGFSPKSNTIPRAHDNDEYLNSKVFLRGIRIYMKIIPALANAI